MKRSFEQRELAASTGTSDAGSSALNPTAVTAAEAVAKKRRKLSENQVQQDNGK